MKKPLLFGNYYQAQALKLLGVTDWTVVLHALHFDLLHIFKLRFILENCYLSTPKQ